MTQDNCKTAESIYNAFNNKNLGEALKCISDQLEWTVFPTDRLYRGKNGFREFEENWMNAFPDGKVEITHCMPSGTHVVVEYVGRGTHLGTLSTPMGDMPPSGKRVELNLCDVLQLENGLIVKGRTYFDSNSLMQQISEEQLGMAA